MKKKAGSGSFALWLKREKWSIAVLALAAALFAAACIWLRPEPAQKLPKADYVEYEKGVVTAVVSRDAPDVMRDMAMYCMAPAYMVMLMPMAQSTP